MRMSGGIRFLVVAGGAVTAWLGLPAEGAAQCSTLIPPCVNNPPVVSFTPSGGTYTSANLPVKITWGDDSGLIATSREIRLNGTLVTTTFTYTGNAYTATSERNVPLQAGANTVTAKICDNVQCTTSSASYTYQAPPPPEPYAKPVVSVAPMSQGVRRADLCALDCYEAVVGYTTPAYVSLDTERAVTLVYRSGQGTRRRVLVEVDAVDNSANVPQKMSIRVRRPDATWVTFTNGSQEIFYTSGSGTSRLAAQFDPGSLATGSYVYQVVVRTWWSDGTMQEVNAPVDFRFTVLNEQASPFGSGWTVAGLQRLKVQDDGILITEGDGSAVFFTKTGTNAWSEPVGEFTKLTYNTSNSRYTRTYPDKTLAVFNSNGTLRYVQDRFGNTVNYAYSSGRLTTITDPIGKTITFAYSASNKVASITDAAGRQSTFVVNASGYLTQITDPDGVRAFALSWSGTRLVAYTDRRGATYDIAYDAHEKLASVTAPEIPAFGTNDPIRPKTTFLSWERAVLPASGGTSGSPAARVLPQNARARVTDPRSNITRLALNSHGAPTFIHRPLNDTTRLDWDQLGQLRGVRTSNGHEVKYNWLAGNLTRIHDTFTGTITTITYESAFNQVKQVSVGGVTVKDSLGSKGEVLSRRVGEQPPTKYTYDTTRYRVLTVTDPEGLKTENVYQTTGFQNTSLVRLVKPGMTPRTTTYTYDTYGRVATVTDPLSNVSKVEYDVLNRPTKTTDPRNFVTNLTYSANKVDLYRVTDAKSQVYTYERNALGWVQTEVDPGNRKIRYQYDANGNLMQKQNRRNQLIVFEYDALDRIWKRLADGITTFWTYDGPLNRWTIIENNVSRDEIYYDQAGRMTDQIAIRAGRRHHLRSTYQKEGPRDTLRMIEPWSRTVAYHYNNAMRLDSLRDIAGQMTRLTYNNVGLPSSITLPTNAPALKQTLAYTPSHALASSSYTAGLSAVTYSRDNLDRMTSRGDPATAPPAPRSNRQFTYDKSSQLTGHTDFNTTWQQVCPTPEITDCYWEPTTTQVGQATYGYDAVGNRTDKAAAVQAGNRLTSFDGWTLQYDADGNLTSKAKSGQSTQLFEWNSLGQLTKVTVGSTAVTHKYDALGRWAQRVGGGETLDFIYDEDNLFMEVVGTTRRREYTHYPGLDRLHSVVNWQGESGVTYYYGQDDPGHVIGLVNANKQAVNKYSYDPWGSAQQKVEAKPNPMQFMGRYFDGHGGLYQVRARWYDPQVGRFISEDPIGLEGGINTFTYVGNDPVNNLDPYGLDELECYWTDTYLTIESTGGVGVISEVTCTIRSGRGGKNDRGSNWPRGGADGWAEWAWPGAGPGRSWGNEPLIGVVPGMEWIAGPGRSVLVGGARKFIGKPYRTKIGAGGRPQPYGADGRYLPFEANPGVAHSPMSQIASGVMSGYLEAVAGTPSTAFPSRLYEISHGVGRLVGSIRQLF